MQFFHGTSREFQPGDTLLPPRKTGVLSESGRKKNLDRVFFTADPAYARVYAGRAANSLGGKPRVYQVEFEDLDDVEVLEATEGRSVLHAPKLIVIKEVT